MAAKEILDKRVIDLDMNAKTKDEVIRHLAGLLHEAGYVDNLEGYIKDVYLRESEGITGIGGHVAIPHGKSDYVDKVGIAVGRTHDMVDVVFLLAVKMTSQVEIKRTKQFYKDFLQLTDNDENLEALKKLKTPLDIYQYFIK